jgi:glycosyltransferase involved in cell wall biosynthesis
MGAPVKRPRALFVQPTLRPPGGGNGVAAWMIQALAADYDVTLLAWSVDIAGINRHFGTALDAAAITVIQPPALLRGIVDAVPLHLSRFKDAILRRMCHRLSQSYDVAASAFNEFDFGRQGIQYVHYPTRHIAPLPDLLRWFHRAWAVRAYDRFVETLAPFDDERMKQNTTLSNSAWTARLLKDLHGLCADVLHPPAYWGGPTIAWEAREEGFLCAGRISPEKEIAAVVEIVRQVRRRHPRAHLHLIGPADHATYARRVAALAAANSDWVTWHGHVGREELEDLIARHRYGIHGMREEHFGMAVAEMARAGCITFVPAGGGQVEVADPDLLYASIEDAVARIERVLDDPEEQQRLSAAARRRTAHLDPERFMDTIRGYALRLQEVRR